MSINWPFLPFYGYTHNDEKLYYSFLLDFKTQFARVYSAPSDINYISDFMDPGYLNLALVADYKSAKDYSIFFPPFTGRFTFVLNGSLSYAGAFGVTPGERIKNKGNVRPGLPPGLKPWKTYMLTQPLICLLLT